MIESKFEDLMWERIDGTITPQDDEELEVFIKENPEAGDHFEALNAMSHRIDSLPDVEPPADLRQRIHTSIDPGRYATQATGQPGFLQRFIFRWDLRMASAVAAGVLVGVIGYHIVNYGLGGNQVLDNSILSGTMVMDSEDGVPIGNGSVRGEVHFHREQNLAVSVIRIESRGEISISMDYAGRAIGFLASGTGPARNILLDDGQVTLEHLGKGVFRVVFDAADADASLHVTIQEGDATVFDQIIPASN